jgi:hypothetical protein
MTEIWNHSSLWWWKISVYTVTVSPPAIFSTQPLSPPTSKNSCHNDAWYHVIPSHHLAQLALWMGGRWSLLHQHPSSHIREQARRQEEFGCLVLLHFWVVRRKFHKTKNAQCLLLLTSPSSYSFLVLVLAVRTPAARQPASWLAIRTGSSMCVLLNHGIQSRQPTHAPASNQKVRGYY